MQGIRINTSNQKRAIIFPFRLFNLSDSCGAWCLTLIMPPWKPAISNHADLHTGYCKDWGRKTASYPIRMLSGWGLQQSLCKPDLDNWLSGNTESPGLFIQRMNHPEREINIDSFLLLFRPSGFWKIQVLYNAFSLIKLLVKVFSFHISQSLHLSPGAQR